MLLSTLITFDKGGDWPQWCGKSPHPLLSTWSTRQHLGNADGLASVSVRVAVVVMLAMFSIFTAVSVYTSLLPLPVLMRPNSRLCEDGIFASRPETKPESTWLSRQISRLANSPQNIAYCTLSFEDPLLLLSRGHSSIVDLETRAYVLVLLEGYLLPATCYPLHHSDVLCTEYQIDTRTLSCFPPPSCFPDPFLGGTSPKLFAGRLRSYMVRHGYATLSMDVSM